MMPLRIQLHRTKGWRLPANTVKVDRTTRWGNFYRVGDPMDAGMIRRWGHRLRDFANRDHCCSDAAEAVRRFNGVLSFDEAIWPTLRAELRGKNLACWCKLCDSHQRGKPLGEHCDACAPCHSDPLGSVANA
jgi:hypothetical protein